MPRSAAVVPIRLLRIVLACAVLVGATIAAAVPAGGAAPPAPTGISAVASTDNSTLGGAVPAVLVAAGSPFTLTVTLTPAGATFNTDTKLSLTPSLASGAHPGGSLSPASIVMPGGVNSAPFSVSYSAVDNGVQVTVSVAKATGKSQPGDAGQRRRLSTCSRRLTSSRPAIRRSASGVASEMPTARRTPLNLSAA